MAAAAAAAASRPAPAAKPASIELAGVIFRGEGRSDSQALLSFEHGPQQVLRAGDAIADGWTLRSIAADHVVIARAGEQMRVELMAQVHAAAASAPTSQRTVAPEKPLPGFAVAPPPRALTDGDASERNRRFLEAVRKRRVASGS